MAFEFELPDVGEGVAEGELLAWHVAVGDHVDEDEVLAEVETDKAVVDLPSPVAGTVRDLHAEEGDVVPVGDVVVTIDVDDEVPGDVDGEAEEDPDAEGTSEDGSAAGGRVFAPPHVRRLARELGVDVAAVDGSGPGGRVTEGDVREAADTAGPSDEAAASADTDADEGDGDDEGPTSAVSKASPETKSAVAKSSTETAPAVGDATSESRDGIGESPDRDRTLAAPSTRRLADEEGLDIDAVPTEKTRDGEAYVEPDDVRAYAEAQRAAQEADAAAAGEAVGREATADSEVTREPYRGIRRTIGERMEQSAYTAPHVTHHDTAVVDDLVETRADLHPRADERGIPLTYLPFVMKAVVAGLKQFPVLNTMLDEEREEVVYRQFYNIGVAVATDAGLMVPVVENVDRKGLLQLASETAELAERARERDLAREEMQGGTFSVTNFGAIGGEYATPIINYPETAILGLGSIEQRPTVDDGDVVAAHTLPLSLSIDHRVIDGAEAARFVNTVIEYLEDPTLLLLE